MKGSREAHPMCLSGAGLLGLPELSHLAGYCRLSVASLSCSSTNLKVASSLTPFGCSYILYSFSWFVFRQFLSPCVYIQDKHISVPQHLHRPPAEPSWTPQMDWQSHLLQTLLPNDLLELTWVYLK